MVVRELPRIIIIFETFDHSGEQIKKNTKTKKGKFREHIENLTLDSILNYCDVYRLA